MREMFDMYQNNGRDVSKFSKKKFFTFWEGNACNVDFRFLKVKCTECSETLDNLAMPFKK